MNTLSLLLASLLAAPFGPLPGPSKSFPKAKPTQPITPKSAPAPTCGTIKLRLPDLNANRLVPVGGKDTEMGGGWRRLFVQVFARHTKRDIILDGQVSVEEEFRHGKPKYKQAPTSMKRMLNRRIPVVKNAGCEISSISIKEGTASGRYRDGHNYVRAYGKDLIDWADCRSDTKGDDEGKLGCSRIRFREIEVTTVPAAQTCPTIKVPHTWMTIEGFRHTRGDTNMAGNDPYMELDGQIQITSNGSRVSVRTDVEFRESKPDTTTFNGSHTRIIFLADRDAPGCEVASVNHSTGRMRAQSHPDRRGRPQQIAYGHQIIEGFFVRASCRPDAPGNDRGRVSCGSVVTKPLEIRLRRKD